MSFEPGTHGEYSSTDMVLAGLVILSQAPEGRNTFATFDFKEMLGLDYENDFKHLEFPVSGALNKVGATVAGDTHFLPM